MFCISMWLVLITEQTQQVSSQPANVQNTHDRHSMAFYQTGKMLTSLHFIFKDTSQGH